jgi:hypothetical protein
VRSFTTTTIAGTVTAGGTSQEIAARNSRRDLLMLLNPDGEEGHLYYNLGDDAASDGTTMSLAPGQWVKFDREGAVPTASVHVTAADTGHKYVLLLGQRGDIA